MNQKKIADTIKRIRKDNNLTQEALANELNVTYQAVSKWERELSLPDISTLQIICKKYSIDINDLLDTNVKTKNKSNILYLVIIFAIVLVIAISTITVVNKEEYPFETRELGTTCKDFTLSGTISYDRKKSNIYISNIDYCGKEDNETYIKIESKLISEENNIESVISSGETINNIKLKTYLKELKFNVSSKGCGDVVDKSLKLIINAYTDQNKSISYEIPLKLGDTTC